MGRRWLIAQRALVRIMDEQSWALNMGEEDGVSVGRIYDGVGWLGTWGLGLGAWVGERGGSELGRRVGFVVAWVKGVGW